MKFSHFAFLTDNPETDEVLLYNTLNGAMLAFEKQHLPQIKSIQAKQFEIEISDELTQLLADEDFLVEDTFNEIDVVLERSRLGINDSNRLDVIIMPNMNCNFACVYCYEDHIKSGMNIETQEQLLLWLDQMVPKFKVVLISWFGGEPMLSYPTIVDIQEKVQLLCIKYNVVLNAHITTNGSLLEISKAKKLLSLGIHSYQITLDGPPETHNQMRPLKGGGDSFDNIYKNICDLAVIQPTPHIKLRINYDERNIHAIGKLLEMFPLHVRSSLTVVCEKIFKESFGVVVETMERGEEIEHINQYANNLGYRPDTESMEPNRLTFCYADRANQFLFNYNGDVFKCTVQKFDPKHRLGYLSEYGTINWEDKRRDKWMELDAFEEKCYACVFMPLCMGGCRKLRAVWGVVGDDCTAPFIGFEQKVRNYYANTLQAT